MIAKFIQHDYLQVGDEIILIIHHDGVNLHGTVSSLSEVEECGGSGEFGRIVGIEVAKGEETMLLVDGTVLVLDGDPIYLIDRPIPIVHSAEQKVIR